MRSSEAAAIADILFQSIDALANSGRSLTDDARHRFAGRLQGIDTPTIRPYPLSLEPDPIHPSSYYLAVDGLGHGRVAPLLLRFGLASSPASGLFPKSVLIGRMRPAGGREVVVNAIPFGPTDVEPIRTFNDQVTKTFQPRPQGGQPALIVSYDDLAPNAEAAFEAFRQIERDTNQNRAAFAVDFAGAEAGYFTVLWAAVRAGWRTGYSLGITGIPAGAKSIDRLAGFSRFSVLAHNLDAAAEIYDRVRKAKMRSRGFDFELDFRGQTLSVETLTKVLQNWRTAGRTIHSLIPPTGSDFEALSACARQYNVLLTLEGPISLKDYGRGHRWLHNPTLDSLLELARD